ncbi:MAG: glycosyltransferase, partial [Perlabentimonas sp.]
MESANNKPRIILYTLTRDRLDYTKQTFEGMRKTAGIEFDHFILDNGSEDGTQNWLRKWRDNNSNTKLYLAKENMGLWAGINTVLSKTNFFEGYDFVCKLDNDVDFNVEGAQDWLLRLYKVAMSAVGEQWVLSPYVDGLGNNSGGAPRMGVDLIHNKQISLSS